MEPARMLTRISLKRIDDHRGRSRAVGTVAFRCPRRSTQLRRAIAAALLAVATSVLAPVAADDGGIYQTTTASFSSPVAPTDQTWQNGVPQPQGPDSFRGPPGPGFGPGPPTTVQPVQYNSPDDSAPQPSAHPPSSPTPTSAARNPIPLDRPGRQDGSLSQPGIPTATGSIVTVVSSLAIVLGLFSLLVWFTRRNSPQAVAALSSEVVQVLGRAPLSGRQQMHLVQVGHKLLLVSVTPTGAETLTEITDPQEVERMAALCQQSQPGSITQTFRSMLGQIGEERPTTGATDNAPPKAAEPSSGQPAGVAARTWGDRHEV